MKLRDLSILEQASLLSGASEWDSRGIKHAGIPSFVMSDGPHGVRRQLGSGDHLGIGQSKPATCFPTASALANSWDPRLAEEMGKALGEEAKDLGVNVLLGPGLNIKRNPLCGRNFEYYSEDPIVSGKMASGLIAGIQTNGISACPKHFAINSQELRRQASNSVVDERTMREIYLTAFEIAVRQAHPWSIMTSYNKVNGVYAHENRHLLQEILRDEWGFDGLVISDWGGSNSAVEAVKAGGSLEMPSPGYTSTKEIMDAVANDDLSPSDVARRAAEVAEVAVRTHISGVPREALLKQKTIDEHHGLARRIAQSCMVLLKNRMWDDHPTLPLQPKCRVALIGDMASNPRFQGAGSSKVNATRKENLVEEFTYASDISVSGYEQGYERNGKVNKDLADDAMALAASDETDVIVVALGLDERSESEGLDRDHMRLAKVQNDLVRNLRRVRKPLVIVLIAGSPVELPWIDDVDALLYIGLAGQAGASAAVKVMTGDVNPSGHLAESWPISYADCPSSQWYPSAGSDAVYREGPFVGYRYYSTANVPVRFPFGFGLTYAQFSYSDLRTDDSGISFTIRNDSDIAGQTVAQFYVRGPAGGVLRPDRELKAFSKVSIGAHESADIRIDFDAYTFRHFDVETGSWRIESGQWTLMVGQDCEHIELRAEYSVAGDMQKKPADPELGSYLHGDVKKANDAQLDALFGFPVSRPKKTGVFTANDPIISWQFSQGLIARAVARLLLRNERRSREKTGSADLNALFVLNMPPRAMCKMTNGLINAAMVDSVVEIANGHLWHGIGSFLSEYLKNRRIGRRIAKELHHE
ncbi:glycoside hydrolase family 3 C-terminal domain-containing protein [Bifidobacterium aquikefiri]|uniref:glycoside hydrolase family 3 C-terminal domain-containing protein n=1 Tax=Bifidobacterium aquikefiri TaxID=1653207 RepID=UPI0039E8AA81